MMRLSDIGISALLRNLWQLKAGVHRFLSANIFEPLWQRLHFLTYSPGLSPKRIVVIGGSHGGYTTAKNLAKSLPSGYSITVIEKDRHLNHVFAFPRYSVYGGYENNAFIPLADRDHSAVPTGSIDYVYSRCLGVDRENQIVRLENGQDVSYEYLVIATGAKLTPPVALTHDGKEEGVQALQFEQNRIKKARSIAVIGAGAVGVELASDIKYKYGADKNVTLFSSRAGVLPRFDQIVSDKTCPELVKLGVDLRLNCRPNVTSPTAMVLPDGTVEEFDLIYTCVGGRANSDCFFEALGDAIEVKCGSIRVNPKLLVEGCDNVFAIGDVTNMGPQMARAAFMQAAVVRDNILKLIKGQTSEDLKDYKELPFENALNLTIGLDRNLLHFNGSTDVNLHEEDLVMAADKIWQIFDVKTDNFCWESQEKSHDQGEEEEEEEQVLDEKLVDIVEEVYQPIVTEKESASLPEPLVEAERFDQPSSQQSLMVH